MSKVLVIVDMQYLFYTARKDKVIRECQRLIKHFKANNLPIIILEYIGCDDTLKELKRLYKDYPLAKTLIKRCDDGSNQIHKHFKTNGLNLNKRDEIEIVICGVNIDACVISTTWGLVKKGYNVRVIKSACNTVNYRGGQKLWENYPVHRKNCYLAEKF